MSLLFVCLSNFALKNLCLWHWKSFEIRYQQQSPILSIENNFLPEFSLSILFMNGTMIHYNKTSFYTGFQSFLIPYHLLLLFSRPASMLVVLGLDLQTTFWNWHPMGEVQMLYTQKPCHTKNYTICFGFGNGIIFLTTVTFFICYVRRNIFEYIFKWFCHIWRYFLPGTARYHC